MQKRDDKVGEKTPIKKEKKGEKRAREKGRNRFAKSPNFGYSASVENKKNSCLITSDQSENMPFFFTKLVFSHSYAN